MSHDPRAPEGQWDRPLRWYVRDTGSQSAHLLDYQCSTDDHALCGRAFGEIQWQGDQRPRAVCRACRKTVAGARRNRVATAC